MSANVAYVVILIVAMGAVIFSRGQGSKSITHLLIWAFAILALTVGDGQYEKLRFKPMEVDGKLVMSIPMHRFHNGFVLTVGMNNHQAEALIDTGATAIVLTYQDAQKAGINVAGLSFDQEVSTAAGITHHARAVLDQLIIDNEHILGGLDILVAAEGELDITLLGMDFLRKSKGYEANGDIMRISF